ncbi:MAG TPA: hypothetical protein DCY55_11745 [Gammaproteobacteria bacterium]|jgi:hypothetical protein|nr:hypothetical protein [Gammaproteobacteria bacterium]
MLQFTDANLNNLLAFLNRVQLSGEEAPAMVDITSKVRNEQALRAKPPAPPAPKKAATKKAAPKKNTGI